MIPIRSTSIVIELACFLMALVTLQNVAAAADAPWRSLFDGKTLDGWTQRGGAAKYRVENDQIVGSSVPNTSNSFLCTDRDYGDFVLELEFKVAANLNSGVQIRSQCFDQPTKVAVDGKEKTIPAGRVHGYQVEIDPSDRAWTAGIYDEGRRGWLNDLKDNEPARKAFKPGDWNQLRVECRGDSIKTWLNGVPAADLKDAMTPQGFIALQVHGVGNATDLREVRWQNIRIQELGERAGGEKVTTTTRRHHGRRESNHKGTKARRNQPYEVYLLRAFVVNSFVLPSWCRRAVVVNLFRR